MPAGVDPKSPSSLSGRLTPGTPGGRPGFGLLRRESGFSIASLAASLPIAGRSRSNTNTGEESGQQLITVSRPSSIRSRASLRVKLRGGDESQDEVSDHDSESVASDEEEESEAGEEDGDVEGEEGVGGQSVGTGDARSIRSFESMLSASKEKSKMSRARKSLSDRLASVSALAGRKVRLACFLFLCFSRFSVLVVLEFIAFSPPAFSLLLLFVCGFLLTFYI